jgi:nicotinate phosphoribosyltransferase
MWLLKDTPALFTDLYELTMAQVYFNKAFNDRAAFEVTIRKLPEHWGFFVMAGLAELESYLDQFKFSKRDIDFLRSTGLFDVDFLNFLNTLRPDVQFRALPEGTIFFPNEPALEITGTLPAAQLLESYILNILGFSIIEATLAARLKIIAGDIPVIDFSLRRAQGPVASVRSARAAQMAGFSATSNCFAARALNFPAAGTMAHSFVEVHDSEKQAFYNFSRQYAENAILLIDTYDSIDGIKKAATAAKELMQQKQLKIRGIRLDSGDLVELSKFARRYFKQQDLDWLKIFASGDLDEFKIADLLEQGAAIDGFGIGTNFAVSKYAPAVEIVYKLVEFNTKKVFKTSPDKATRPGRKSIHRIGQPKYQKDIVTQIDQSGDDLLQPFRSAEDMQTIQNRLKHELACLDDSVKRIQTPEKYSVEFEI